MTERNGLQMAGSTVKEAGEYVVCLTLTAAEFLKEHPKTARAMVGVASGVVLAAATRRAIHGHQAKASEQTHR